MVALGPELESIGPDGEARLVRYEVAAGALVPSKFELVLVRDPMLRSFVGCPEGVEVINLLLLTVGVGLEPNDEVEEGLETGEAVLVDAALEPFGAACLAGDITGGGLAVVTALGE